MPHTRHVVRERRVRGTHMFDFKAIGSAMGRETIERWVHKEFSDRIRSEMAKGKDAHNIVVDALIGIRDSQLLELVRNTLGSQATGLALTGLGAGLAEWLQSAKWETVLPGDHEVMRQVRFILQQVVPSLLVGSSEALGDNWDEHVVATVGKVVSDPTSTAPQKKGAYDEAYEILSDDGTDYGLKYGLLFPEWGPDGELQLDRKAVVLAGVNGKRFMQDWFTTHKGEWIDDPDEPPQNNPQNDQGGKNKQNNQNHHRAPKKIWSKAKPYKGRLIPLATAILRMPVTVPMDPELVAAAKATLVKKPDAPPAKDELEKLDEGGEAFTLGIAKSASRLDPLQRSIILDFVQDVTKASFINLLGKKFKPDTVGAYSSDDIKAIEMYVQMWMQAKLNTKSKMRLAFEQAKLMAEAGDGWMKILTSSVTIAGKWTLGIGVAFLGSFALMALLFFYAAFFMNLTSTNFTFTPMLFKAAIVFVEIAYVGMVTKIVFALFSWDTFSWKKELRQAGIFVLMSALFLGAVHLWDTYFATLFTFDSNLSELAGMIVMVTSFVMIVELLLITPLEAALSLIKVFKKDLEDDWLKNKGRITIMFIGLHAGILMFLIADESSRMTRLMVSGAATLIAIAVQMGLVAYGFPNAAKLRSKKTLGWFGIISLVFFVGGIVIHMLAKNGMKPYDLLHFATSNIWFMFLFIFASLVLVGFKAIHMSEVSFREKSTGNVIYSEKRSMPLRIVAIIIAFAIAGWYYYVKDEELKKAPSNPIASSFLSIFAPAPAVVPPVVPTPAAAAQVLMQPIVSATPVAAPRVILHNKRPKALKHSDEDPCAGYEEDLRSQIPACK